MTEPVDPQERYLERLRAVWDDEFGTTHRPGLADTFASSDASIADLARIGAMVRGLDVQMQTRLNKMSGATERSTGAETDLLHAVGAGHEAVKVANYHATASAEVDSPWWQDVQRWVGENIYGVDLTDPDLEDESVRNALTSPGNHLLMGALGEIGKFAGFVYRSMDPQGPVRPGAGLEMLFGGDGINEAAIPQLEQRVVEMKAQGYDTTDIWDNVAFNWNGGESTFRDLTDARRQYGNDDVNLALEIYRSGWRSEDTLFNARVDIENQFAAGEITAEEATAKIQRIEDPDFVKGAYEALDRLHVSPGRDLARGLGAEGKAFSAVSGTTDALWTFFADPTILGGKAVQTARVARWGIESLNDSKIYHLLGEVDEAGVAPAARYVGAGNARRAGVENFLKAHDEWRTALAAGDEDAAAVIYAGARERHRELFPLWSEVGGVRPAITVQERQLAAQQQVRYIDALGNELPGIRTNPITTVREFADHAVNNFAFQRLTNGMASQARPLLPGKVGLAAERRAIRAEKRTRLGIDTARENGDTVINFSDNALSGVIPDEARVKMEEAATLRGQELFDQADAAELTARKIRAKADAVSRRLSTFLPQSRALRLNSASDSKHVEQFARIFLPKWEAARYASIWEAASPAGRRTLAKAMLIQSFEAAGLTASPVGKELADKYINDLARLERRRYGYGESDLIKEGYRNEARGGLYESHIDDTVSLPSFTELRQLAAKAAVMGYDPALSKLGLNAASARTLAMGKGRKIPRLGTTALRYFLFNSTTADRLMKAVKLGWILTPANMLRNAGDEGLLIGLTGQANRLNRGRELLQRAGMRADLNPALPRHRFLKSLVPKDLRPATQTLGDVAHFISIGRLRTLRNQITDEQVEFVKELEDRVLHDDVLEVLGGRLIDSMDEGGPLGHGYAREAAAAGIPVERFKFEGYKLSDVDADTGAGLEALVDSMGQRFMPDSPANATLAWMMWQDAEKMIPALDVETVEAMQRAFPVDNATFFRLMHEVDPNFIHSAGLTDEEIELFTSGAAIVPPSMPAYVKHIVDDPRYNRLQEELELYNINEDGSKILPGDEKALRNARARMARRYMEDIKTLMTGRNGEIDPQLASMLIKGDIPDPNFLRALGEGKLPPHAIKAQYAPADQGALNGVFNGYTALLSKGYDLVVTRPIRAMIRTPLYADFYVTARESTKKYADELVSKHGWERQAADDLAIRTAEKHALNEVVKFIDNPKVASQFSGMNRNWWGFFRAQEDWIRRYGRAIKADPAIIQKAHLAIIGAEDAGILDRDAEGNLILTYPGSGAVVEGFLHLGAYLGITDPVLIPDVADLSTRLTFTNPSLNNPWGYSSTPMVSIPFKVLSNLAPGGELLKQVVDRRINGELGAGRTWLEQILPVPLARAAQLWQGDEDNTGSFVGGIMATAMTNMALNGSLEKYADTDDDRARFITDLQTQARNVAGIRAFMALFAPGSPAMPQIGDSGDVSLAADLSYQQAGIQSLRPELQNMVARMGVGPAYQLFSQLHPEADALLNGRTETAPGAVTPSTMGAASYVYDNKEFFTGDYRTIAPYFLPETPGEFDPVAWRTLTEMGVRQYKDLDDMFIDLVNANGVNVYYAAKDASEAAIAEARLNHDTAKVQQLQDEWRATRADLDLRYPTLDDYFTQGSARALARKDRVATLEQLIADPNAPADVLKQLGGATDMVRVYREFEARTAALGTSQNNATQAEKANLRVAYHDAMRKLTTEYPSLEDAYNGIFRSLVEQE